MAKNKEVKMSGKEFMEEHRHLLNVLKHPTKKKLLAEYISQHKEVKDYVRGK